VLDTPIAESGTLGIAAGAALLGMRRWSRCSSPTSSPAASTSWSTSLAKLFYRFEVPLPAGGPAARGGGVGAGPFHSQNPEGWFAHVAGLKVVCPATAADAKGLLKAAIRDPNPVSSASTSSSTGGSRRSCPRASWTWSSRPGADRARRARPHLRRLRGLDLDLRSRRPRSSPAEGVEAEVVDLRTLVPLDEETLLASVLKTGRCIVVHEDLLTGGFGGEIAARLADAAFAWLDAPVARVAHPDRPSPYARILEQELMPDRAKLLAAARETLAF
jgi:pyruvate/2-oxoglutarate/acetoin dehydrogenase E1 component